MPVDVWFFNKYKIYITHSSSNIPVSLFVDTLSFEDHVEKH